MFSLANGCDGLIPEFEDSDFNFNHTEEEIENENAAVGKCINSQFNDQQENLAMENLRQVPFIIAQPFIGQKVMIPRNDGRKQEAYVTKIFPQSNNSTQQIENTAIEVQWTDSDNTVRGKTLDVNTLLTLIDPHNLNNEANIKNLSSTSAGSNINSEYQNNNQTSTPNRSICDICVLSFKNQRGLRIHLIKKHPLEANSAKLNSLLSNQKHLNIIDNPNIKTEIDSWDNKFKSILNSKENFNPENFDDVTKGFVKFLREANIDLPGPKHPSQRYYKLRKKNKASKDVKGAGKVSNPQRSCKNDRQRRQEQYQYEVAQYYYYNRRKNIVNKLFSADYLKICPINIKDVETHYKTIFEHSNDQCRESYEQSVIQDNIVSINLKSIHKAIKSTSLDTCPGPDGVLIRTVKCLEVAHIIKTILEIFLKYSYLPEAFRKGRTVLIYKGKGKCEDMTSWRPITMYSILRRIIEKVLDAELRQQVSFHSCQRGFVKGLPGCHVNSRLIDAILKDAKAKSKDCTVAFLDVTGAFDSVGHLHIINSLKARGASDNLVKCIEALLCNNQINIRAGTHDTDAIFVKRGVPQGGPISATLFNLAIDHIYREFCDPQFTDQYGYNLNQGQEKILLSGFADDQAVTASSADAAVRVTNSIVRRFKEIGLLINPAKSTCIIISKGKLLNSRLNLEDGSYITSNSENEVIKYLGCSFTGEMVCNESAIVKLNNNLNSLVTSNLLKPDQKLNILNQYIFPTLTYPLQTAPLTKLRPAFLEGVDVIIRRCTKAIVGLPANSSTAMLYAPRRYRGLGILRCLWEAPLQHMSILQKLKEINEVQLQSILDYDTELSECADRLGLEHQNLGNRLSTKKIRQSLREKAFDEWSKCKWQGIGVCHFKDNTKANEFIRNRQILTGAEWTNAIKLNINYAPLRGVPTTGSQYSGELGPLCRRCSRETETPAHVLGNCPNNMLLVTRRHHNVKHKIIDLMKEKGYTCYEEVFSIDSDGSTRYADIIAFKNNSKEALVIDPTVRYESNDPLQGEKVNQEKKSIYDKCLDYYKEKYHELHGEREYQVRGLWFGSRGAIPKITSDFFDEVGIDRKKLTQITESIILDSLGILNNHIYG